MHCDHDLVMLTVPFLLETYLYYAGSLTRNLLTYSSGILHQVIFAVSIPNIWGTIDKLATLGLQPGASRAFCDLVREVDGCEFHLHIMFRLRVTKTLRSLN